MNLKGFISVTKIDNIKTHFKKHQRKYVIGGTVVVGVGVTGHILWLCAKNRELAKALEDSGQEVASLTAKIGDISITGDNNVLNITQNLKMRGHSGFVTQCVETGEIFASQNRAAEVFGADPGKMSKHLNGLRENINGYHFVRLFIFPTDSQ
jgi:hypothetical protein